MRRGSRFHYLTPRPSISFPLPLPHLTSTPSLSSHPRSRPVNASQLRQALEADQRGQAHDATVKAAALRVRAPSDVGQWGDGDAETDGEGGDVSTKQLAAVGDQLQAESGDPGLGAQGSGGGWGTRSPILRVGSEVRGEG